MFLGPAAEVGFIDQKDGMLSGVNVSLNTILGRFRRSK
jgi:hypothetical protein